MRETGSPFQSARVRTVIEGDAVPGGAQIRNQLRCRTALALRYHVDLQGLGGA